MATHGRGPESGPGEQRFIVTRGRASRRRAACGRTRRSSAIRLRWDVEPWDGGHEEEVDRKKNIGSLTEGTHISVEWRKKKTRPPLCHTQ